MVSIILVIISASFTTSAVHAATQHYSYAGVDAGLAYCNLQQNYGSDIFSYKPMTQLSVFVGYQFAPMLAFELGYERALVKLGSTFVPPGTGQFNIPNFSAIASSSYATKRNMYGYNFYYAPQLNIYKHVFVMLLIGLEYVKTTAELFLVEFDGDPATTLEQEQYKLNFVAHKIVPKIALRLQYGLKEAFFLHAYAAWAQTSRISMQTTREIFPTETLTAKLKNTTNIGIGVMYKLKMC